MFCAVQNRMDASPARPFFSIVVPCCDVGPYVRQCIDSVAGQPFGDWEMLAVVEKSRDDTEQAVLEAAARDPRIRAFTGLPRSGSCSVPRNTGVEAARGDYVVFLDGDDTLAPDALSRLAERMRARPGADLYPCAVLERDERSGGGAPRVLDNYPASLDGELDGPGATLLAGTPTDRPHPMLQMTLFRRAFLVERGLRCIPGLRSQDNEFSPRALYLARRVAPLHEPFYEYRVRAGSIQTGRRSPGEHLPDFAVVFRSLFAFHAAVSAGPDFDRRVSARWAGQWLTAVFRMWFGPERAAAVPRDVRRKSLAALFADGFGPFDALLRHASRPRRIAGFFVRLFVRHPRLAPVADFFFLRLYHPLCDARWHRKA